MEPNMDRAFTVEGALHYYELALAADEPAPGEGGRIDVFSQGENLVVLDRTGNRLYGYLAMTPAVAKSLAESITQLLARRESAE